MVTIEFSKIIFINHDGLIEIIVYHKKAAGK